jgi:hypothetical protein
MTEEGKVPVVFFKADECRNLAVCLQKPGKTDVLLSPGTHVDVTTRFLPRSWAVTSSWRFRTLRGADCLASGTADLSRVSVSRAVSHRIRLKFNPITSWSQLGPSYFCMGFDCMGFEVGYPLSAADGRSC